MAKQTINIGAAPNDGTGDPIRTAFDKANDNFDELYAFDATLGTAATTDATDYATAAQGAKADSAVQNTGNETIGGIKTFTSSPIVPAPTTDLQAATKKYVDDSITAGGGYTDEQAQDAVGGMLNASEFTYTDATPDVSINQIAASKITGTKTAAFISDFDTEVSNNTDVAANTSARHSAVTVTDSTEIDFTLTGQNITASLKAGSIDESKLDASVNASLDKADSALQSSDIGVTVQAYSAVLAATTASFTTADETKLDGIEANADVTDTDNVRSAGALMDDEVTNLADVKAFDPANYATAAQGTKADSALQDLVDDTTPQLGGDLDLNGNKILALPCEIGIACSDETTALTTGTAKATFRMPYAMTLTAVRASLTGAGSTSGTTTIDINEAGTTVLSTKLTIDAGEKTSTTAATPAVISDSALADDAEITIDIDAVSGGADETGLKVWLIGTRA